VTLSIELRAQTSKELTANLQLSGLSRAVVEADLDVTPAEFEETITLGPESSSDAVWRLRSYLDGKLAEAGTTPYPYSALDENRP